ATFATPAYVAPERLDGRKARPENDTYALGGVLYEMLTGHPPFPVETWEELAALKRGDPPRPTGVPGLPTSLADLCQRCLATDPLQRPTASRITRQLRRYQPGTARHLRFRAVSAATTAAALVLGVVLGALLLNPDTPPSNVPVAEPDGNATPSADRHAPPPTSAVPPSGSSIPPSSAPPTSAPPSATPGGGAPPPTVEVDLTPVYQLIDDGEANDEIRD